MSIASYLSKLYTRVIHIYYLLLLFFSKMNCEHCNLWYSLNILRFVSFSNLEGVLPSQGYRFIFQRKLVWTCRISIDPIIAVLSLCVCVVDELKLSVSGNICRMASVKSFISQSPRAQLTVHLDVDVIWLTKYRKNYPTRN